MGTVHLTVIPSLTLSGAKRGNIESVRISKRCRNKGYGTMILNYVIALAKKNGCKICQLTTNKKRLDAQRFYERLGFVATHEGMKLVLQ